MDQNMWAQDLPVWSHPEPMDCGVYSVHNQACFSTHEPSQLLDQQINTLPAFPFTAPELPVCEFSQDVMHFEEFIFGYPRYTFEEPPASFNFQQPVMNQNLWEDGSNLVDLPIQFPPAALLYTESSQGMLHNEDYNFGHCGYRSQPFSSPLMEVVQGATTSSSRQTRCETGNSSRRPYVPWSIEDVTQLISAVHEQGAKVKRWDLIVRLPYFKDKGRKKEHLMEKWRHMTRTKKRTKDPKCPMMKELYILAREVEAKLQ